MTKLAYDDSLTYNGDGYVEYAYDDLHRLTKEQFVPAQGSSRPAFTNEYWYDAVGNRTKYRATNHWYPSGRIEAYQYSPRNELTKSSDPEGSGRYWMFEYDPPYGGRGNLTKRYHTYYGSSWFTYEWDSQDRLTKVVNNAGSKTIYYKYDLLGRRVAKKVNAGDWKWFFYDGLQVLAEGSDTDSRTTFTLAPSAIGGIIARDDGTNKLWYHFDRLGNVVGVTDENGDVVRVYNNDAFGRMFHPYESDGYDNIASYVQWYHLTTKEYDADTGLYYFNARWYDRNTGRFMSRDLSPAINAFDFCRGNPVRYSDATGLDVGWALLPPNHLQYLSDFITCSNYCLKKAGEEADRAGDACGGHAVRYCNCMKTCMKESRGYACARRLYNCWLPTFHTQCQINCGYGWCIVDRYPFSLLCFRDPHVPDPWNDDVVPPRPPVGRHSAER